MIELKALQNDPSSQLDGVLPCSFSLYQFFNKNKVVQKSVTNRDLLEPFNCKGLFTTTYAIKIRSYTKSLVKTWPEQLATGAHLFIKKDKWGPLLDRNSEPGLIGIGLVPSLRTLFSMNNIYNHSSGGLA